MAPTNQTGGLKMPQQTNAEDAQPRTIIAALPGWYLVIIAGTRASDAKLYEIPIIAWDINEDMVTPISLEWDANASASNPDKDWAVRDPVGNTGSQRLG
jgi:hypothetical protein